MASYLDCNGFEDSDTEMAMINEKIIMKSNLGKIVLMIGFVSLGFWLGVQYEMWRYDDICLDIGGGRNPGGYPICVIKK